MITMSDQYSRGILKMVIAQICQMIGWHSINSTPLEFLVDLMQEYLLRVSKVTHQYSEILGRTEANLDDLGLAFRHMHVLIPELSEYVRNVDSVPCIVSIPKFPVCRDNHLNFLKPGSQEVVTRPVHVHEHLPAMFPNTEESCLIEKDSSPTNCPTDSVGGGGGGGGGGGSGGGAGGGGGGGGGSGGSGGGSGALPEASLSPTESSPQSVFKRPGGLLEHSTLAKRSKIIEEGRPLREIHSVIMTTSGFLSPAREGKLPEPRTPHPARADSPPSSSYPMVPPELKTEKKVKKIVKKGVDDRKLDKENKKKNRVKELFKPDNITEIKGKKVGSNAMKEVAKIKPPKCSGSKGHLGSPGSSSSKSAGSVAATAGIAATATAASTATDTPQLMAHKEVVAPKTPKSSQSRVKNDRLPEVVTSIVGVSQQKEETVDKLPSEPDKQKLNIFKKISKPREEKNAEGPEAPLRCKELDSRESSPGLIIDEITDKHGQRSDKDSKREEKKTPRTPEVHIIEGSGAGGGGEPTDIQSPTPDVYIFDDMSPPGTPSTPKTPELSVPVPVDLKTNKKKKDRNIRKKEQRSKSPKPSIKPKKVNCQYRSSEFQLKAQSGSGGGGGGDEPLCERPKTPQAVEAEQPHKEPSNSTTPALPFPFFPPFPSAPGLIPHPIGHPMFPRYPLPLGRGVPGAHPAMPNLPMPPRFLTSNIRADDCLPPKVHPMEREKSLNTTCEEILEPDRIFDKFQKPIVEKVVKSMKLEKEITQQQQQQQQQPPATVPCILSQNESLPPTTVFLNSTPTAAPTTVSRLITKNDKLDKNIKKSKDHKKERKDKLKKKKDKKEKHKIKDKSKGKKGKLTKLKDKKEKKDKRKEKEKDEKSAEAVPKITLKLGPASPRPPTPDNTTMKKITIKPLIKKPDEEKKREPSPELAKIAALVTRPPKQKITKLKADAIPKKSDGIDEKENGKDVTSSQPINVEQASSQVWICPACGNQDDGSPMIGCDDCDAWYHWVCVGVQVPPADHENWYCPLCITKKQELHNDKKKKKRKKKVKPVS